jgi:ribosomal protein L37AE/L43A
VATRFGCCHGAYLELIILRQAANSNARHRGQQLPYSNSVQRTSTRVWVARTCRNAVLTTAGCTAASA